MIIVNIKIKMVIFKYDVHLLMNSLSKFNRYNFFYQKKADLDQILLILHFIHQFFF